MNTIAVVSDIHGNMPALERVAADIRRRGIESVLNLGDHASGPLWPAETIRFLMLQDWVHIAGNHDRRVAEQPQAEHGLSDGFAFRALDDDQKQWLRSLPATARPEKDLFLFHGSPSSDSTYLLETLEHGRGRLATREEIAGRLGGAASRIMLCGHTHVPRVIELPGDVLIVNPGSVGLPAYQDDEPEPHVMETGSPHARYAILEPLGGSWVVEEVVVPYDHEKAARQAEANGRRDWALGLRTGFMSPGS